MKFDGQIYAMQTGRRTAQVHNFLYQYEGKDSGEPLEIAYYYWCIKRGDYTILISVGSNSPKLASLKSFPLDTPQLAAGRFIRLRI